MSYTHLSLEERHYIEIEKKNGVSINMISKSLNRDQGTISREIKRNTGQKGYRHTQANNLALQRHRDKPKSIKLTDEMTATIGTVILKKIGVQSKLPVGLNVMES